MSEFLNNENYYKPEKPSEIDFDDAIRLPDGGSTCLLYRTKWQRRDVFVKRLKEEFRSKPLYLDALDKEYDIGVRLKHPSLPEYREFHRDYIVIDYIDGMTLADMIRRHDPWLKNGRNVLRMFTELIGVVEYLHRHNVVHCDIKADNIMITAKSSNLVLVDFDKCYTDSLSSTSGHPEKYGLSIMDVGRTTIDFRAIGKLVEKLDKEIPGFKFGKRKQFIQACNNPEVTCDDLRQLLSPPRSSSWKGILIASAGVLIVSLIIIFWVSFIDKNDQSEVLMTTAEITPPETAPPAPSLNTTTPASVLESVPVSSSDSEAPSKSAPDIKGQEDIHADARKRAEALDQRIQPEFNKLLAGLDRLQALKNDSSLSGAQLLADIRRHDAMAEETITEAFEILKETSPNISDREAWRIMAFSKAYTGYTRRASPELKEFGKEIERRLAKESRELTK